MKGSFDDDETNRIGPCVTDAAIGIKGVCGRRRDRELDTDDLDLELDELMNSVVNIEVKGKYRHDLLRPFIKVIIYAIT